MHRARRHRQSLALVALNDAVAVSVGEGEGDDLRRALKEDYRLAAGILDVAREARLHRVRNARSQSRGSRLNEFKFAEAGVGYHHRGGRARAEGVGRVRGRRQGDAEGLLRLYLRLGENRNGNRMTAAGRRQGESRGGGSVVLALGGGEVARLAGRGDRDIDARRLADVLVGRHRQDEGGRRLGDSAIHIGAGELQHRRVGVGNGRHRVRRRRELRRNQTGLGRYPDVRVGRRAEEYLMRAEGAGVFQRLRIPGGARQFNGHDGVALGAADEAVAVLVKEVDVRKGEDIVVSAALEERHAEVVALRMVRRQPLHIAREASRNREDRVGGRRARVGRDEINRDGVVVRELHGRGDGVAERVGRGGVRGERDGEELLARLKDIVVGDRYLDLRRLQIGRNNHNRRNHREIHIAGRVGVGRGGGDADVKGQGRVADDRLVKREGDAVVGASLVDFVVVAVGGHELHDRLRLDLNLKVAVRDKIAVNKAGGGVVGALGGGRLAEGITLRADRVDNILARDAVGNHIRRALGAADDAVVVVIVETERRAGRGAGAFIEDDVAASVILNVGGETRLQVEAEARRGAGRAAGVGFKADEGHGVVVLDGDDGGGLARHGVGRGGVRVRAGGGDGDDEGLVRLNNFIRGQGDGERVSRAGHGQHEGREIGVVRDGGGVAVGGRGGRGDGDGDRDFGERVAGVIVDNADFLIKDEGEVGGGEAAGVSLGGFEGRGGEVKRGLRRDGQCAGAGRERGGGMSVAGRGVEVVGDIKGAVRGVAVRGAFNGEFVIGEETVGGARAGRSRRIGEGEGGNGDVAGVGVDDASADGQLNIGAEQSCDDEVAVGYRAFRLNGEGEGGGVVVINSDDRRVIGRGYARRSARQPRLNLEGLGRFHDVVVRYRDGKVRRQIARRNGERPAQDRRVVGARS